MIIGFLLIVIIILCIFKEQFQNNPKHSYDTCLCETAQNKEYYNKLKLSKKKYNKIKTYTYYVGNNEECINQNNNNLDNLCPKTPGFKLKGSNSPDKLFPKSLVLVNTNENKEEYIFKMGKLAPLIHKIIVSTKQTNDEIKNKLEHIKNQVKGINLDKLVQCVKEMDIDKQCNSLYMDKDIKNNTNNNSNNNDNMI